MVGVFAGDCLHRDGLSDAQFVTSGKFAGGHQLAARITGDIGENALDVTNSVLLQKGEAIRCGMERHCWKIVEVDWIGSACNFNGVSQRTVDFVQFRIS